MSSKLTTHVVENHDEALPVLYRAIGSKLLPLEGSVLVHFDSHPDLLIPRDLLAADIYNKHQLFESVSIENWILPAVFAGHFTTVVWVKPPWSHQIPDGYFQFYIGRHKVTSKIRVTSKLPYFVGETLYTHEDNLEDKRSLSLYVISINSWRRLLKLPASTPLVVRQNSHTQTAAINADNCSQCLSTCKCPIKRVVSETDDTMQHQKPEHEECTEPASKRFKTSPNRTSGEMKSMGCEGEESMLSLCEMGAGSNSVRCAAGEGSEAPGQLWPGRDELQAGDHRVLEETAGASFCHFLHSPEWLTLLSLLTKKPFVLDIDLDFFSTMDPFRALFTPRQYHLLKTIYAFRKPTDHSDESVAACVASREEQLQELKAFFSTARTQLTNAHFPDHTKDVLIKELIAALYASPPAGIATVTAKTTPSCSTDAPPATPASVSSQSITPASGSSSYPPSTSQPSQHVQSRESIKLCNELETKFKTLDSQEQVTDMCEESDTPKQEDKVVEIEFDWLHEIGCGCDDTELPDHVSSEREMEELVCGVEDVLGTLPEPRLITVARSSEDDYCPKWQVEGIQRLTLDMLARLYRHARVTLEYMADTSP